MKFSLEHTDPRTKARACKIKTDHGTINTPIFMPVGTAATVKGIDQKVLKNEINPDIILANNYHLILTTRSRSYIKCWGYS
jgi:queuine tRNA-ribosyltransferase